MYVTTLLGNPAQPLLEGASVEALRGAWGGGRARWLAPGVAAEFDMPAIPGNRWQVWQDFQGAAAKTRMQRPERTNTARPQPGREGRFSFR